MRFAYAGAINSGRLPAKPIRRDAELNPPAAVAPEQRFGAPRRRKAGATHSFSHLLPMLTLNSFPRRANAFFKSVVVFPIAKLGKRK
jgi:hypothetical protein